MHAHTCTYKRHKQHTFEFIKCTRKFHIISIHSAFGKKIGRDWIENVWHAYNESAMTSKINNNNNSTMSFINSSHTIDLVDKAVMSMQIIPRSQNMNEPTNLYVCTSVFVCLLMYDSISVFILLTFIVCHASEYIYIYFYVVHQWETSCDLYNLCASMCTLRF